MRDVWVTGIGMVSTLGSGIDEHARAVRERRSGLAPHDFFGGVSPDPVISGLAPSTIIDTPPTDPSVWRAARLLDHAVRQAIAGAGLDSLDKGEIVAGTTLGNMQGATEALRASRENRPVDPRMVEGFLLPSSVTRVTRDLGFGGRALTICSACGSGAAAIGHAFQRVRFGETPWAIAGGYEALSPFVVAGFNSLRLVSKDPCRPFDRERSGLNPGEGACLLVLEDAGHARARGAGAMARVIGYGAGLDAYHYTRAHPEGKGLAGALTRALDTAGVAPGDIDHLHLHGTATEANDSSEYAACRAVFGEALSGIPACSTKSMTGHCFAAASALTAAFLVIALREDIVPATLNCDALDCRFGGLMAGNAPRARAGLRTVAATSLGFGGEAFALVMTRAGETP